jgi:hypothetical protein
MFRRAVAFVFLSLISLTAVAQLPNLRIKTRSIPELQADQRTLVGQWCRLDFEGTRLSDDTWKKFDGVTNIKRNPEFSSVYLISRYQINPPERVSMEASVTYNVIGRYEVGIGYQAFSDTRYVTFKFSDKDGDLQIVDLDPSQPNVSKPAFLAWLKAQIATTKNASEKMALQHALDQLVPPPPKPKTDEGSSSSQQPR